MIKKANKNRKQINYYKQGFTLVEVLVGVSLLVIVFAGIFGAYRLGMKVVGLSKNKITATALANAQIEKIRNLSYESVGTKNATLPLALGALDHNSTATVGNVTFEVVTEVRFSADPADGIGLADSCDLDYKKASVTVSWGGTFPGNVFFSTNISPKNQVQELQSCQSQPGGVLSVTVFDAAGIMIPSPNIKIYDPTNHGLVASATPTDGKYSFLLAPQAYRVEVSKTGYSGARTYSTDEVAVPDSADPTVLEGDQVPISLSIALAASISVDGVSPNGQDNFADSFDESPQISGSDSIQLLEGDILLSGPVYSSGGWLISSAIAPSDLVAWNELRFDDSRPAATDLFYQILYYDGANWVLVPDSDLGGNSTGFRTSPVNLAGLDGGDYAQIKIKGNLSTNDSNSSPRIHSWQVVWTTDSGVPVPGAAFYAQGTKSVGEDDLGQKVYKYSQNLVLDGSGHLDIIGVDGDAYQFSVSPSSGLSLIGTDPAVQPINVAPGGTAQVKLFLRAQNSLLVTVQNDVTLGPVFSAAVRLVNSGSGYDKTQYTDQKGQTYFAPLSNGTYDLSVSAPGFSGYSGTVTVSGSSVEIINIHQNE